jgi:hypothetical protein
VAGCEHMHLAGAPWGWLYGPYRCGGVGPGRFRLFSLVKSQRVVYELSGSDGFSHQPELTGSRGNSL